MEFAGRAPGRDLAPFVRSLWFVRGAPVRRYERILPQAVAHLIVNLSDPYRLLTRGGSDVGEPFTGAFLSGLQREYLVIENPDTLWQCGAELTPAGVAAFTTTPLRDLTDRVQDAAPILRWSDGWRGRLQQTATADDALEVLQQLLRSVRRPEFAIEERVARAVTRLDEDPDIPIAALATEVGLSSGGFAALFRRGVGMTPKAYADLARFVGFLRRIPFDDVPRWGDLVAGSGYYDQAHFIRSFKRYAGVTPSQYLEGIREFGAEYPSFLPMDSFGAISDNDAVARSR
jgi:AraC-like DNA-binding protein